MNVRGGLALAAGVMAGLWIDTLRRTARAERRHPPQGHLVEAGNARLHVVERGHGTPVVFLHGAGALVDDITLSLFDTAAESWRAIAVDRPGSGHSERPWGSLSPVQQAHLIHDGLTAMGVRKPVVVGHSLGGAVALAYALEFPDEAGGVVVLAGYCYPTARVDFLPFMALATPLAGPLMNRTLMQPIDRAVMPLLLKRIFAPNPVPESYRRMPYDLMLRPSQLDANAADLSALIPAVAAMASRYPQISCPLAILAGEEDRIVDPDAHAARLHRDVPGSTLHRLAGTGHMLHHVRPEAVLAAIERVVRAAAIDAAHAEQAIA